MEAFLLSSRNMDVDNTCVDLNTQYSLPFPFSFFKSEGGQVVMKKRGCPWATALKE